jgi:putative two-component system response regulator
MTLPIPPDSASAPFEAVLQTLLMTLEARELQLRRRAEAVANLCAEMAGALGLDEATLATLRCGALLHDIGNIGVPDAILLKPTGLSDWEFQEVKLHPIIGERILQPLKAFDPIRPLVRSHHEKLDGSGYPDGLEGDDIPLLVRILSVADVYQTLRTERAFRAAFSHEQALEILRGEIERGWWDDKVVAILQSLPEPAPETFDVV